MFVQVIQGGPQIRKRWRAAVDRWRRSWRLARPAGSAPPAGSLRTAGSSRWSDSSPRRPPGATATGPSRARGGPRRRKLFDGERRSRTARDVTSTARRPGPGRLRPGDAGPEQRPGAGQGNSWTRTGQVGGVASRHDRQRRDRPRRWRLHDGHVLHVGGGGPRGRAQGGSAGDAGRMDEMNKLSVGDPDFFDLKRPVFGSPN